MPAELDTRDRRLLIVAGMVLAALLIAGAVMSTTPPDPLPPLGPGPVTVSAQFNETVTDWPRPPCARIEPELEKPIAAKNHASPPAPAPP